MLSIYWVTRGADGSVEALATETLGLVSTDRAHDRAETLWPKVSMDWPQARGWQIVNEQGVVLLEQFPEDFAVPDPARPDRGEHP